MLWSLDQLAAGPVKHLALASRCHVTVDSVLGQGSTFTVHLKHEERP